MSEPSKIRVLFVEDDVGKRYVIARQLRQHDIEVDEAETGEQGLAMITAAYDVAILDLHLPGISGHEVCRQIKAKPTTKDVMVLELSATLASAKDRARGLELGADAYLVHPVEIIELVATLKALTRLRRAVFERDLERELFMGTVGHDLRNPLAAISNGLELLSLSTSLGDKDRTVLQRMSRSSVRMRQLIDQLLLFTQTLGGALTLEREQVDLADIARTAVVELERLAPERPFKVVDGAPAPVEGDPIRLAQIVENLVSNAIKHGTGTITVRVHTEPGWALLCVHNEGRPIPPEVLPTVFDPFKRGTQRSGGFGLGLYIVERIARAHHGGVEVTSTEGEGTTFVVRLPTSQES